MIIKNIYIFIICAVFAHTSCEKKEPADGAARTARAEAAAPPPPPSAADRLARVFEAAEIPADVARAALRDGADAFLADLEAARAGPPELRQLVDKARPLDPPEYEPPDLVALRDDGTYRAGRAGLRLRREAEAALEAMAGAARAAGVTLTVSSAYRSYDYQAEVYARNVRESGRETADRESARPGHSQHQTGLAVDFGSITDAFARTAAGAWTLKNAAAFGWSLSFPDGYEALTGYRWESWHYRYVGAPLAAFIGRRFGGVQQYALRFIHEWERP